MLYSRSSTLFIVTLSLVSLAACQSVLESPDQAAQGTRIDVRKSPNDTRSYRYLELPNKMRVLLASDPTTDKSAASLSVYRGSFHEPADRPGIAHFLEHMLFIQTEAYPEPNAFQGFVSANGGSSNAYTAPDHTNYFFNVRPSAFPEALDRWGHFFINPIISDRYAEREKNAVHSEYQMQIKSDGWRNMMVSKQTLKPDHPGSRFTIGSLDTLAGDIQADLIEFFEEQYSADQMGLVVLSNTSLDELEAQVRDLFGRVENKNLGPAYVTSPLFEDNQLPMRVDTQTIKDGATLTLAFQLPTTLPHYRVKPQQYFANLIGHEGEGSLHEYLKAKGWIESLGTGVNDFDRGTSFLRIAMGLTKTGESHQNDIIAAVLAYIELLKATPPEQWLYDEQAKVAELGFRFQEKSSPTGFVYQMSPSLDKFAADDLLVAPYLMERFDAALIERYISGLTSENLIIEYNAPDAKTTMLEPWFEVPFAVTQQIDLPTPIEPSTFRLPAPNPFLPEDLALKPADDKPIEHFQLSGMDFWLDRDVRFGTPRAQTRIQFLVPGGFTSPRDRAMAQLYRSLVIDSLSALTYPAFLAGLSYNLSAPDPGFEISLGGYSDRQGELFRQVLTAFLNVEIEAERFDTLKAALVRGWNNEREERPYQQTFSALAQSIHDGHWPPATLVDALTPVTVDELVAWRTATLERVAVRGLLHGNVDEAAMEEIAAVVRERIEPVELDAHLASARSIPGAYRLELPIEHNDASLVLHVQDPDETPRTRAISSMAAQIVSAEYFEQLRTEQQLGYVVSATNRPIARRGGMTFIVQSPSASPAEIETATIEFMTAFAADFERSANDAFEEHRAGVLSRLLEAPKNLGSLTNRYWADLNRGYLDFDSREQIAEAVRQLTPEVLGEYFDGVVRDLNSKRLAIYNRGKFDTVPSVGTELASPTEPFEAS